MERITDQEAREAWEGHRKKYPLELKDYSVEALAEYAQSLRTLAEYGVQRLFECQSAKDRRAKGEKP